MSADLDAEPIVALDPSTYARPRLVGDAYEVEGLLVRRVKRLPEPDVRDGVAWAVESPILAST